MLFMHHIFPLKDNFRKMGEEVNGDKNEGRDDETMSFIHSL